MSARPLSLQTRTRLAAAHISDATLRLPPRTSWWQEWRASILMGLAAAGIMGWIVAAHSMAWPTLNVLASSEDGERFILRVEWQSFGNQRPDRRCEQFRDAIGAQIGQRFSVQSQECTP